jgi:hypothetical protein
MSNRIALPLVTRADDIEGLQPSERAVLHRLCLDADCRGGDVSLLSSTQLMHLTGFSDGAVRKAMRVLIKAGMIIRHGDVGGHVWQTMIDPKPLPPKVAKTKGRIGKSRISGATRKRVMERDGYRCKHCGDHRDLSIDHILPRSAGGTNIDANLQTLCVPCNVKKGAALP